MRARRLLLPALAFALLVRPVQAAQTVTVAQFEQIFDADQSLSDARASDQLAGLTLSERVTAERLADWQARAAGENTRQVLLLLADESAFRPLPDADIAAPPPAAPSQTQIFNGALLYAGRSMHNLPNFFATRRTRHFHTSLEETGKLAIQARNSSRQFTGGDILPRVFAEETSVPVTYRDGGEAQDAASGQYGGLESNGEFGPLLSTVLADAEHGSVSLAYWQKQAGAPLAVFRYTVPAEQSHYAVRFGDILGLKRQQPAYHGELSVDPATGAILRVTIVSTPTKPAEPAVAVVVEYGAARLGSRSYVVPLHAAAISKVAVPVEFTPVLAVQTYLNDVVFTDYHLFRATTRILLPGHAQ